MYPHAPQKKTQLALKINLFSQEKQNSPSKGRDSKFYCLSEGERAHLLSDRETFTAGLFVPFKNILEWKEQEEIVYVNDDEENFSEEISFHNDKSIDLDMID